MSTFARTYTRAHKHTHTHTHTLYHELAYVVKETEKSMIYPGKPVVCFSLSLKAWELRSQWCKSVRGQEKTSVPAQPSGGEAKSPFPCLFALLRPSVDWVMPIRTGRAISFTQSTDSHPEIMLAKYLVTPWPVKLIHKIITPHKTDVSNRDYSWEDRWGLEI